ncbi:biotin synthase BioB [Lentisphaerota bacterium WC36G]|nr:biotin synthase BioB [Lentisphaerae bacterium WC36]
MSKAISNTEALKILQTTSMVELLEIFKQASAVREEKFGDEISTCAIVNARSGNCPEDCAYCSQSCRSKAEIEKFQLLSAEEMFKQAQKAEAMGAKRYGIVTAGRAVNMSKDLDEICKAIKLINENTSIKVCASLGILNKESLQYLKDAGLDRYHHNLEASESFFPEICTTREFSAQLDTIRYCHEVGLSLCVGGIFGMGESLEQRVELLDNIRTAETTSVPINFLTPIDGTPLAGFNDLTPLDCLKITAAAKLMMPETSIRVCGGREFNLHEYQSWLFAAGVDSIMIGSYLTTSGRSVEDDIQMIKDGGLKVKELE